jgi:hypothetical protein
MKEALTPLDQLKSVLCDPEGKCCIAGSDEDRAIVDRALEALAQPTLGYAKKIEELIQERDALRALAQPAQGLDEAAIRADEREACAKVCESYLSESPHSWGGTTMAAAIRARGNT